MEKTNDILRMKEYLRNMQACIADLIEQVQMLAAELDDMLVEETTGKRFMVDEEYDVHRPLDEMGIKAEEPEPSVSITHSEAPKFSQCPAPAPEDINQKGEIPAPPVPEPPKKQGILSRIRKDPKVDIEKENRDKMLKELEAQMEELKKKR